MPKLRYIPVTQQPYCCVPASLQMVLLRRGLPLLSQEDIGTALHLTVPVQDLPLLPHATTDRRPTSGWGTQVQKLKDGLNTFFKQYDYPLEETFISNEKLPPDVDAWLHELIDQRDADVIVCFNYAAAFGGNNESDTGHVAVLDSIDEDMSILIDPWAHAPKVRPLLTTRLLHAMALHGAGNRAGFWVIEARK